MKIACFYHVAYVFRVNLHSVIAWFPFAVTNENVRKIITESLKVWKFLRKKSMIEFNLVKLETYSVRTATLL